MMKKILALVLALVMACSLIACGGKEEAPAAKEETKTEAPAKTDAPAKEEKVNFPTRTINMVCPWSAGGGTDAVLRALCMSAEKYLGQTITVTNTTGGGGATGFGAIMAGQPDGYNMGMITFELSSLKPQGLVDFDYTNFDCLMQVNFDPATITVPADAPYDTIEEFIEWCKAHPGEATFSGTGTGGVWHIALCLFADAAGIDVKWVPSDGAAPAVVDLMGGHLTGVSVSPAEVLSQVKAGDLKILAVMDGARSASVPDVPTMAECGFDITFGAWRGLALPKGVGEAERAVLIDAFEKAWNDPDFIEICSNMGLGLTYLNSEDFTSFLAKNLDDVTATMQALGLAAQ